MRRKVSQKPLNSIFNMMAKLVIWSLSNGALWEGGAMRRCWETKFTSVSGMLILFVESCYKSYT